MTVTAFQSLESLATVVPAVDVGARPAWGSDDLEEALQEAGVTRPPRHGAVFRAPDGFHLAFRRPRPLPGRGRYQMVTVPPAGQGYSLLAAIEGRDILGVFVLPTEETPEEVEVELEYAYVSRAARGRGIAGRLADAAVDLLALRAAGRPVHVTAHIMSAGGDRVVERVVRGLENRGVEVAVWADYEYDGLES